MSDTCRLLKSIYRNAKTATDAIDILIKKTQSEDFLELLEQQREEYYSIARNAGNQLAGRRQLPPEAAFAERFQTRAAIYMSSVNVKKTDRMAEALINGSTGGVIEISRILNSSPDAEASAKDLAVRLMSAEQNNIRLMQNFL